MQTRTACVDRRRLSAWKGRPTYVSLERLTYSPRQNRPARLMTNLAEKLGIQRPEPIRMPDLGLLSGPGTVLVIQRGIIPEPDDRLDPRFDFLGRGQDLAHRREPLGQGQHDTAVAEWSPAVRRGPSQQPGCH